MRHPLHSTRMRFTLPGMVELLRQLNLYPNTRVRKHYDDYKLLKDVLHRPRQRSLEKLSTKNFWKSLWVTSSIFRLLKKRLDIFGASGSASEQALIDSQLLMVEVKPSNQPCHFLFVGQPKSNTLFILKEEPIFTASKIPSPFLASILISTATVIIYKKAFFLISPLSLR